MFLVGILSWWYGDGWKQRLLIIKSRLARTSDYFSISILMKTLLSPYRQISAGSVRGPIGVQLRASIDRLISRIVGMFVRLFVIIAGVLSISLQAIMGVIVLLGWMFVPAMPIIGLMIFAIGWVPLWH
jgi:ABC-type microcin C transport system permease subunit YejE